MRKKEEEEEGINTFFVFVLGWKETGSGNGVCV